MGITSGGRKMAGKMKGEYAGMTQNEVASILLSDYEYNCRECGRFDCDFAELDDAEAQGFRTTKNFRAAQEKIRARYEAN
jgi:hypothetical protein